MNTPPYLTQRLSIFTFLCCIAFSSLVVRAEPQAQPDAICSLKDDANKLDSYVQEMLPRSLNIAKRRSNVVPALKRVIEAYKNFYKDRILSFESQYCATRNNLAAGIFPEAGAKGTKEAGTQCSALNDATSKNRAGHDSYQQLHHKIHDAQRVYGNASTRFSEQSVNTIGSTFKGGSILPRDPSSSEVEAMKQEVKRLWDSGSKEFDSKTIKQRMVRWPQEESVIWAKSRTLQESNQKILAAASKLDCKTGDNWGKLSAKDHAVRDKGDQNKPVLDRKQANEFWKSAQNDGGGSINTALKEASQSPQRAAALQRVINESYQEAYGESRSGTVWQDGDIGSRTKNAVYDLTKNSETNTIFQRRLRDAGFSVGESTRSPASGAVGY